MVDTTATVAANVVEAALKPPPSHTLEAPPSHPVIAMVKKGMPVADDKINFVRGGCGEFDDVGLLVAIAYTSVLTPDAVLWAGIREGRGRGFGGDQRGRWMVLRELFLGTSEALVLNEILLWELVEVLI